MRFFFHILSDRGDVPDTEGLELPSLGADVVKRVIAEVVAGDWRPLPLDDLVHVVDESGHTVLKAKLSDFAQPSDGNRKSLLGQSSYVS